MDDCGWKLMKVDEGGLKWMKWMKVDENEWKMDENDEINEKWMKVDAGSLSSGVNYSWDISWLVRKKYLCSQGAAGEACPCKCTGPCWPESCVEIYVHIHRFQILLSLRKEETLQSSFHMEGRATSPWLGLVWEAILALWSCWCKLFPCFHLDCKTCLHII